MLYQIYNNYYYDLFQLMIVATGTIIFLLQQIQKSLPLFSSLSWLL